MGATLDRRTALTGTAALVALAAVGCSTNSARSAIQRTTGPTPSSADLIATAAPSSPPVTSGSVGSTPSSATTTPVAPSPTGSSTPSDPATARPSATPIASRRVDLNADPGAIISRATVPALTYHQIRDYKSSDSAVDRNYIIPPAAFRMQLRAVADAGYSTISPDQYLAHLTTGAALPEKPIMISFDDTDEDGFTIGLPELSKYHFTGTYFIMTVAIGKLPHYMTADQIRRLDGTGHTIAAHTWDHHRVDKYSGKDWQIQLIRPAEELTKLLKHPIPHFGYPFGVWKPDGFPHLKAAGYQTAFQLNEHKMSTTSPLYTIRRAIANPKWTRSELLKAVGPSWT